MKNTSDPDDILFLTVWTAVGKYGLNYWRIGEKKSVIFLPIAKFLDTSNIKKAN